MTTLNWKSILGNNLITIFIFNVNERKLCNNMLCAAKDKTADIKLCEMLSIYCK